MNRRNFLKTASILIGSLILPTLKTPSNKKHIWVQTRGFIKDKTNGWRENSQHLIAGLCAGEEVEGIYAKEQEYGCCIAMPDGRWYRHHVIIDDKKKGDWVYLTDLSYEDSDWIFGEKHG